MKKTSFSSWIENQLENRDSSENYVLSEQLRHNLIQIPLVHNQKDNVSQNISKTNMFLIAATVLLILGLNVFAINKTIKTSEEQNFYAPYEIYFAHYNSL